MVVCRAASASDAWSIYHPIGLSNGGCSACRRLVKRFNFSSDCGQNDSDVSFSSCRRFLPRQRSSKRRIGRRSAQPCAVQIQSEFRGEPRSLYSAPTADLRTASPPESEPVSGSRRARPPGNEFRRAETKPRVTPCRTGFLVSEIMETRPFQSKVFDFSAGREKREMPANTVCCVVGRAGLEPATRPL